MPDRPAAPAHRRQRPLDVVLGVVLVALVATATVAVAADAAGGSPAGPHPFTTLEQLLLGAVATEASVIAFLFYRLESSRQKLYEDARAEGEEQIKRLTAALEAIQDRLPPKEDRSR